jgi:hypothetical protein
MNAWLLVVVTLILGSASLFVASAIWQFID